MATWPEEERAPLAPRSTLLWCRRSDRTVAMVGADMHMGSHRAFVHISRAAPR